MREKLNTIFSYIQTHRKYLFAVTLTGWILYAFFAVKGHQAAPSTTWMHVYSYKDFPDSEDVFNYLRELRTGIPPILSYLEITSYNRSGSIEWIMEGLYQFGLVMMFILPFFFIENKWSRFMIWLLLTLIFLPSVLLIHPGNPQLYDILMPGFLLAYLLFSKWSFSLLIPKWLGILLATVAGFFLTMAELARPFILLILPILMAYNFFHYRKTRLWGFAAFLFPILLFSGIWHTKLLYQHGQLIWSNHGGTNLYRAWAPFVDESALKTKLRPEAPPVNDFGWAWKNLNTEIHTQNSKARQKAVIKGVFHQPGAAILHLLDRTIVFTQPQTELYTHRPKAVVLNLYKPTVRFLYILLGIMVVVSLYKIVRSRRYFFDETFIIILLAGFLTFIPIIGETDEEARFVISVLPLLMLVGYLGVEWLWRRLRHKSFSPPKGGQASPKRVL